MKKTISIISSLAIAVSLGGCSSSTSNATPEATESTATETAAANPTSERDMTTDVVVVGGGGAGITAALSAAENGAQVILIEKLGYIGGATQMSAGLVPAVGTHQQEEAGIEDNNDWFARDILRPNNYSVREDLVYTVVEESKETVEWMEGMGVNFNLVTSSLYYGQSNYRMHWAEGSGAGMVEVFRNVLDQNENITIYLNTPGTGLITNEAGEVIGVTAEDSEGTFSIYADNVVLATSGFAGNQEMLEQYMPEIADAYKLVCPGATGEGILWGQELGAAVANMKAYQGHAFYSEEFGGSLSQGMANIGGIFVNVNGVRFTNEYGGYSELAPHVLAQPGNFAYIVINEDIKNATAAFASYEEAGIVISGNTVEELAANLGVPEDALKDTFDRYVASIERGEDEFNKTKLPDNWNGPFYAMKITGDLRHTQGGLVIDVDAHVLREDGSVIQGLYAAGGVTEGFASAGGAAYMSGDGLLQALIYGKIAGANAATETKGNITATVYERVEQEVVVAEPEKEVVDNSNTVYTDGTYEGVGQGHGGDIKVSVTVTDGKVSAIEVLEQAETPAIYESAVDAVIAGAIEANGGSGVDTVTGATESSDGILEAVDNALEAAK